MPVLTTSSGKLEFCCAERIGVEEDASECDEMTDGRVTISMKLAQPRGLHKGRRMARVLGDDRNKSGG